ncbi:MAG TPA: phosphatase PAP2 family protein [Candidatus Saccharimonadales bacterium]
MHELVTIIAEYFIFLSLAIGLFVWVKLKKNDKKQFILLAIVGGIITLLLAKIGSKLYFDPRPFVTGHFIPYFSHSADNGFPSDHTLLASFLAILVLKYNQKAGIGLFVIAIAIGVARVIAGIHHLIDIIGSIIFALLGYFIGLWVMGRYKKFAKKAPQV